MNVNGLRLTHEAGPPRRRKDSIPTQSLSPVLGHYPQQFELTRGQFQFFSSNGHTPLLGINSNLSGNECSIRMLTLAVYLEKPVELSCNHAHGGFGWKPHVRSEVQTCSPVALVIAEDHEGARGYPADQRGHVHRIPPAGHHRIDYALAQDALLITIPDHFNVQGG